MAILLPAFLAPAAVLPVVSAPAAVDFRFAPPEWQTAICLPDDPHKSLVDRGGELLYHYGQGGREFGTRVGVEVVADAIWQGQELLSPRIPLVRTWRAADGLEIVEETFAVTDARPADPERPVLRRLDGGGVNRDWAVPPAGVDPVMRHILVHQGGPLRHECTVPPRGSCRVALVLCEGWWNEPGCRIQILRVEGAEPRTVDTVADIGQNVAAAFWFDARDLDGNGQLWIQVEAAPEASDQNTILNGLWVFPADTEPDSQALIEGELNRVALARANATMPGGPIREDMILVRVTNTGSTARTLRPRLVVDTRLPFAFEPQAQRVRVNDHETISASLRITGVERAESARRVLQLESVTVAEGASVTFCVRYGGGGSSPTESVTREQALACRARAVTYWEQAPLPYGRVQVPDPNVQALLDAAVRNIWQAREIKQGLPAFQVGPTCYRGLWIVDGAFLLEAAAMLGAGQEARNGVAYELTFQQPDGRIQVMRDYSKENGIVLWTCVRHAQLTQDPAWLESLWPRLERIAEHLRTLRQQTLTNDSRLDDGLLPAGFPDGGIGGVIEEYTNPYWNLAGLRAFIQAAQWLGKVDAASRWQREYDDFMAAFRRAAQRDLKTDPQGHPYLPIRMDGQDLPQRGQWAFCHAVYPGQIFAPDDPLVIGTLAMLEATEREGMVYGTGWDATGLWNYFASFYGHAWLWQGHGDKAARALIAFANHAAPTLVWREEQSLRGEPFRKVGDMPHNWASAEFIRLAVHLLALDRGRELHLFEGLPADWVAPGALTRLDRVATPFGPLTLNLQVSADGRAADLRIEPLSDPSCTKIVVHRASWTGDSDSRALELDPARRHELHIGTSGSVRDK
jgi:hypothetical protein